MDLYAQLIALYPQPHRAVAKITAQSSGGYTARTTAGNNPVPLKGTGYSAGQTVFYDTQTGQILETAPDLAVADIAV